MLKRFIKIKGLFGKKSLKIYSLIFIFLFSSHKVYSRSIDLKVFGLTLHTQPLLGQEIQGKNLLRYPYSLDKRAIWIFSPGFYFAYDNRSSLFKKGLSIVYDAFVVMSCYGDPGMGFGAGLKYRFIFLKNFYFDIIWYLNALIYTREFQPTYELDTKHAMFKGEFASLGFLIMHDIPDSNYKFIMPLPVYFDFNFGYLFNSGTSLGIGLSLASIQVLYSITFSFPIDKLFKERSEEKSE